MFVVACACCPRAAPRCLRGICSPGRWCAVCTEAGDHRSSHLSRSIAGVIASIEVDRPGHRVYGGRSPRRHRTSGGRPGASYLWRSVVPGHRIYGRRSPGSSIVIGCATYAPRAWGQLRPFSRGYRCLRFAPAARGLQARATAGGSIDLDRWVDLGSGGRLPFLVVACACCPRAAPGGRGPDKFPTHFEYC